MNSTINLADSFDPKLIAGVTFDVGFTLLEPVTSVAEVYSRAAEQIDRPVDFDALTRSIRREGAKPDAFKFGDDDHKTSESAERNGWRRFTRLVAEPFPELVADHARWHERIVEIFDRGSAWKPIDGATETLDRLVRRGIKVAAITNWHSAVIKIAEYHRLIERLEFMLISGSFGRRKPHGDIFFAAGDRLKLPVDQILHVGDSLTDDVEGARSAGMHAALLRRKSESPIPSREPTSGMMTFENLTQIAELFEN